MVLTDTLNSLCHIKYYEIAAIHALHGIRLLAETVDSDSIKIEQSIRGFVNFERKKKKRYKMRGEM